MWSSCLTVPSCAQTWRGLRGAESSSRHSHFQKHTVLSVRTTAPQWGAGPAPTSQDVGFCHLCTDMSPFLPFGLDPSPNPHTHTHKHKEKVSGAPPSTIQAFGRTEHTGKLDGSTAACLFSTVNAGTKLGGSQGQAQKAATRVFRGGEMFENSDPSDHPSHLCRNGRRWLPS